MNNQPVPISTSQNITTTHTLKFEAEKRYIISKIIQLLILVMVIGLIAGSKTSFAATESATGYVIEATTAFNPDFFLAPNGVTVICTDAAVGDTGELNGITYTKRDLGDLIDLLDTDENNPELATSCTSGISNMSNLFKDREDFDRDIGSWDVSSVTDMGSMFQGASAFNQDLNNWNVEKVESMYSMFSTTENFNGDISDWDVSNVINMSNMFRSMTSFNQDLNNWDVSKVTEMFGMFFGAAVFNGNISGWNVSNVTTMADMFRDAENFNGDISGWNVDNVTIMSSMFSFAASFNQDLNNWDVGNVIEMYGMFSGAAVFNGNISDWDVSNVTDMNRMFSGAAIFNGNISGWNVSNVTDMGYMFFNASAFNRDLNGWNVENVKTMEHMFRDAQSFNGDISSWDVSSVTNMVDMFSFATSFNQDLNNWDVGNVTDMHSMFSGTAVFNGNISGWNVSNVTDMSNMFYDANSFNQNLNDWNVENVETMEEMFRNAENFNGDISSWDVGSVTNMVNMFNSASSFNQDISGWCVDQISSDPEDFSNNSGLSTEQLPVWGTCLFNAELAGPNEGWHMLGAPVGDVTYTGILDGLWTQGFPGANTDHGFPNVYWYDETDRTSSESPGWITPDNTTNIIGSSSDENFNNAGRGFIVYVYEDDFYNGTSTSWPKTISARGPRNTGDISIPLTSTNFDDAYQGWQIVSNPYSFSISWDVLLNDHPSDLHGQTYVWDPNKDGGAEYIDTGIGGGYGGIIAPFQAFWVRADDDNVTLTISESHQAGGEGDLYKEAETPLAILRLQAEDLYSETTIAFDDDLSTQPKRYNAVRMPSLNQDYHQLILTQENGLPLRMMYLPESTGEQKEILLDISSVKSGRMTFTAPDVNLPDGVHLTFTDRNTGVHLPVDNQFTYTFVHKNESTDSGKTMEQAQASSLIHDRLAKVQSKDPERFMLTITYSSIPEKPEDQLPDEFILAQNHPNPFNPSTQISYTLPETSDVQLDVYNLMGQHVAMLVDTRQNAGRHTVQFDATNLSSGIYIYRIHATGFMQTKKMMLLK